MAATEIRMPSLAAGMEEALLVRWLKAAGEPYACGEPLAEVETDKATMDIEADHDGVIGSLLFAAGATVPVGAVIATVRGDGSVPVAQAPAASPLPASPPRMRVSPLARRLAGSRGIELGRVNGSGPGGRIVRLDVDTVSAPAMPVPTPVVPVPVEPARPAAPALLYAVDAPVETLLELASALDGARGASGAVDALLLRAALLAFDHATSTSGRFDLHSAEARMLVGDLRATGVAAIARAMGDGPGWRLSGPDLSPVLHVTRIPAGGAGDAAPVRPIENMVQLVFAAPAERVVAREGVPLVTLAMRCSLLADEAVLDAAASAAFIRQLQQLIEAPLAIVA